MCSCCFCCFIFCVQLVGKLLFIIFFVVVVFCSQKLLPSFPRKLMCCSVFGKGKQITSHWKLTNKNKNSTLECTWTIKIQKMNAVVYEFFFFQFYNFFLASCRCFAHFFLYFCFFFFLLKMKIIVMYEISMWWIWKKKMKEKAFPKWKHFVVFWHLNTHRLCAEEKKEREGKLIYRKIINSLLHVVSFFCQRWKMKWKKP